MLNLTTLDAKLQYIRNWQALQDFGITYFLVKVGKSRKEVGMEMDGREVLLLICSVPCGQIASVLCMMSL